MAMHWVLQENIFNEAGFERLTEALQRLELPYSVHKVIPFVGELQPEPVIAPETKGVIVMGSYSMAKYAAKRGWVPGSYIGENLDFEVQRAHWGEMMFNFDGVVCPFGKVPEQPLPFFIRPTEDSKAFTGLVQDWPTFVEWRDNVLALGEDSGATLTGETPVLVAPKREILGETRTWIVDGKVVTASGYKVGSFPRHNAQVDERIIAYANACAEIWSPLRAYVLDVFDTPAGLRIGEVNNINSAGFYAADLIRLVISLETLEGAR